MCSRHSSVIWPSLRKFITSSEIGSLGVLAEEEEEEEEELFEAEAEEVEGFDEVVEEDVVEDVDTPPDVEGPPLLIVEAAAASGSGINALSQEVVVVVAKAASIKDVKLEPLVFVLSNSFTLGLTPTTAAAEGSTTAEEAAASFVVVETSFPSMTTVVVPSGRRVTTFRLPTGGSMKEMVVMCWFPPVVSLLKWKLPTTSSPVE
ncbi:hypothetical protein TYRP_013903 [Tyrophagus putrescentiae]|nr:hypothetical protein TYRP_013903 [Tyrophagus putrescentiae]